MHIISDLFLGFNEFSTEDENIPDVDLVVLNGNLGMIKRGMLYTEFLCKKYPSTQFVFNGGQTEYHYTFPKTMNELDESLSIRKSNNSSWPKNLHWGKDPMIINLRNGEKIDIFCTYGYPMIHATSIPWEDTIWHRDYTMGLLPDYPDNPEWGKPIGASPVNHSSSPVFATKEWINEQHAIEYERIKKWEIAETCKKMLVTHLNPYKDTRYEGQTTTPYKIHLKDGIWVASNTESNGMLFLGASLYSNPGRGAVPRGKIVTIK